MQLVTLRLNSFIMIKSINVMCAISPKNYEQIDVVGK